MLFERRHCLKWIVNLFFVLLMAGCQVTNSASMGRISPSSAAKLILDFLKVDHPDLNPEIPLTLIELTTDNIWESLHIQIFKSASDIFPNQSFIVTSDARVIMMGSAFGDRGVTDMAVVDLDQDDRPELAFAYIYGSGLTIAQLGLFAPGQDPDGPFIAETRYSEEIMLIVDSPQDVFISHASKESASEDVDIVGKLVFEEEKGTWLFSVIPVR